MNDHHSDRLTFCEPSHTYFFDGVKVRRSVSAVWKQFFSLFNAEEVVEKYYDHWASNPTSAYFDLISETQGSDEQKKAAIVALWAQRGSDASRLGTELHGQIEGSLLDMEPPFRSVEFGHFMRWRTEVASRWKCLRVEFRVYHAPSDTAGSIDSLWMTDSGEMIMVDWKRCKPGSLTKKAFRGGKGKGPCKSIEDSPLGHYTCQQVLYATILADEYDVFLDRALLVQLHPEERSYNQFEVELDLDLGRRMLAA